MPRVPRALRLVRVGEVLPRGEAAGGPSRAGRGRRASWAALVGPALAQASALVDVQPDGTLRCVAANAAALHDLMARQGDIMAAWNAVASARGGPRVQRLVAWVADDFRAQSDPRGPPSTSPRGRAPAPPQARRGAAEAPDPACWALAAQETARVTDPGLRAALTSLRARALERGRVAASPPPSPPGQSAGDGGGG